MTVMTQKEMKNQFKINEISEFNEFFVDHDGHKNWVMTHLSVGSWSVLVHRVQNSRSLDLINKYNLYNFNL